MVSGTPANVSDWHTASARSTHRMRGWSGVGSAIGTCLSTAGLFRLSPEQPWYAWHRWQHLYAVPVYSLLTLSWVLYGDFRKFFSGHIGHHPLPRPTRVAAGVFVGTKLVYVGYMLALSGHKHDCPADVSRICHSLCVLPDDSGRSCRSLSLVADPGKRRRSPLNHGGGTAPG
jgi:hypothetical protein